MRFCGFILPLGAVRGGTDTIAGRESEKEDTRWQTVIINIAEFLNDGDLTESAGLLI